MDHPRAEALHAARARAHADPRKARAHAQRAAYHASFGSEPEKPKWDERIEALPENAKWNIFMRVGPGCAKAIEQSKNLTVEERQGLYNTQMTDPIDPTQLIVQARCKLGAVDAGKYPIFTEKCSRFYQNCAAREGRTMDPRVNNLTNASIRLVMNGHRAAICNGTFYPPIGEWDVSRVTDMAGLFSGWGEFNQPIGDWDTSNVTSMSRLFSRAGTFNQPIGNWKTAGVDDMSLMFYNSRAFNQPIGGWDTSMVSSMASMFRDAVAFDEPIGRWRTLRVTDMSSMLAGARMFNQSLAFDTSLVVDMSKMFCDASAFNQTVSFNTARVRGMTMMFKDAHAYNNGNAPLVLNTAEVEDTEGMFMRAIAFNQTARFDTSKVANMRRMFYDASSFNNGNKPLELSTELVTNMSEMFRFAIAFDQRANFTDMGRVLDVGNMLTDTNARVYTKSANRAATGFDGVAGRITVTG